MNSLLRALTEEVPQTEQADLRQVRNNGGGFAFKASDKSRLERFLILGTDGGTYYVKERKHTKDNIAFVLEMVRKNEREFIDTVVDVSVNGRAYKQSPAIFAIVVALVEANDKAYAREAFAKVIRTSTHLFEAVEYINALGGWGRSKRKTVAGWYESKDAESLAYQVIKYRSRTV